MRTTTAIPSEGQRTTHRWSAHSTEGATVTIRTIEVPIREVQVGDLVCDCNGRPHFWVTKIDHVAGSARPTYHWEMTYCSASANDHVETDYPDAMFGGFDGHGTVTIVDTIG